MRSNSRASLGAVEGGGDGLPTGRKLGVVADEDDAAAGGLEAELKEVGEEVAVAEPCACCAGLPEAAVAADHGGLIHDEDRAFAGVGRNAGRCAAVGGGFAEVDAAVDGAGLEAGIAAHDLRGAAVGRAVRPVGAGRGGPDEGGHGGRLSRSGIAANHQATARLRADKKPSQRMDERVLTGGRGVRKGALQAVFNFF